MRTIRVLLLLVGAVTLLPAVAPAAPDHEPQAPRSASGVGQR